MHTAGTAGWNRLQTILLDQELRISPCKPEPPALFSNFIRAYQTVTRSGGKGNTSSIQGCFFPHWSHVPGSFGHLRSLHRQYFALTWVKTSRDFSTTSILNAILTRVTKTIWKMFFHSLFSFSPSRLCPKFQHVETFFSLIRGTYKVKGWKGNLGAVPWAPHTIYSLVDEAFSIPPNFQGKQTQTWTQRPGTAPLFNIEILWILFCCYNCCWLWWEEPFPKQGEGTGI